MAKGWTNIANNAMIPMTDAERKAQAKAMNKLKQEPTLDLIQLTKNGKETYEKVKAEQDSLKRAYRKKKLKSKTAIRQAKILLSKERKAKQKKEAKKNGDNIKL